jgi:hypothetical protein
MLALDVVLWLFSLPVMLRIHTIPTLLKNLVGKEPHKKPRTELGQLVDVVTHVCNLKFFRLPIFPKQCLRQSLTLYRTLIQRGYPVQIHFGVRMDDKNLVGHSWVTLQGVVVADTARGGIFQSIYSYPASPTTFDQVRSHREVEESESMLNEA